PEALRGRHISEGLGNTAWERVEPYAKRALGGEEPTFQTRLAYKSWPTRDIRPTYQPHRDSSVRDPGVVGLSNDVSLIKASEIALRRSERMLERSQSTAHVGSFEVALADSDDARAGTVRWSDETYRMFGYQPGSFAVTHSTFFEFIHPEDRDR